VRYWIGLSWIKLFYITPSTVVLSNSLYSRPFNLYCGTRQVCPLSPFISHFSHWAFSNCPRRKSADYWNYPWWCWT